ncbi:transposase [Leptolyngbya sp. ST-U4]
MEPKMGEHFFFEFSHLNTDCFPVFLNLVSDQFKDDFLIIRLDNGGFHKAKRLKVPNNIILLFQPPHCPELNPIEQVWQYLKRRLRWSLPATLDQLRQQLRERLEVLTPEIVVAITRRQSILHALSVTQI